MNNKKRAIALILYVALCFSIVAGVIGNPTDNKSKIDAQIGEILNTLSSEFVKCDCGIEGGLEKHTASCARVKECLALVANNTASELYSKWDNFPEDAREYILAYLSQNAPDKYLVLKYALDNTETKYEKFDSDLNIEDDTVAVEVMAPEGAFNDGTAMSVEVKDVDKISKADKDASKDVVNAIGDDVTALDVVKSVDITFAQKNNPEMTNLQPKNDVLLSVSLKRSDFSANAVNAALVHIADDGSREVVGYVGLPADNDATVELKAWVNGFSTYQVVESRGKYRAELLSDLMEKDVSGQYLGKSISTFPVTLYDYHGGEMNKYFWENINKGNIVKPSQWNDSTITDHVSEYFAFVDGTAYYSVTNFNRWDGGAEGYNGDPQKAMNTAYFKNRNNPTELTQYQSYLKRNALTVGKGGTNSPNPANGDINGIGINYSQATVKGTPFAKQGIVKDLVQTSGGYMIPTLLDYNAGDTTSNLEMSALFDPDYTFYTEGSINNGIRKKYDVDFEFIYDYKTKTYSYESKKNHAQLNADEGRVELYNETLAAASGMTRIEMTEKKIDSPYQIDGMATTHAIDTKNRVWLSKKDGETQIEASTTATRGETDNAGITKLNYDVNGDGCQFIRYDVTGELNNGVKLIVDEFNGQSNTTYDFSNSYIYIKYRAYDIEGDIISEKHWNVGLSSHIGIKVNTDNKIIKQFDSVGATCEDWVSVLVDTAGFDNLNAVDKLSFDFVIDKTVFNLGSAKCCLDIAEVAVMKKDAGKDSRPAAHGQFFPFENISNSYQNVQTNATAAIDESSEEATLADRTLAISGNSMPAEASHFGMMMEIKFYLPEDRTNEGEPIKFDFSGDDDLWVYVDDELALDIGGCHGQVTGTIEFLNSSATGNDATRFNGGAGSGIKSTVSAAFNLNGDNTKTPDFVAGTILATKESITTDVVSYSHTNLKAGAYHTLRIYYLERGSFESNCNIIFNLPVIPDGDVYIHNDVEYKIAEENGNTSNEENSLVINGGEGERKFKNDDFFGKLYDFKVAYTISESSPVNWQANGLVEVYEYSLYETDNPANIIEGLYTTADGMLSIPAGWTAVVSVPRLVSSGTVTNVYAMELGAHVGTDKVGGVSTPKSDKAFTNLPGNYEYGMDGKYSEAYTYKDTLNTTPTPLHQDLKSSLLAVESTFGGEGSGIVHFQFTNYYTWQIDFGGDQSTTLDIDEDIKVKFENQPNKENWLDGENKEDNKFNK